MQDNMTRRAPVLLWARRIGYRNDIAGVAAPGPSFAHLCYATHAGDERDGLTLCVCGGGNFLVGL